MHHGLKNDTYYATILIIVHLFTKDIWEYTEFMCWNFLFKQKELDITHLYLNGRTTRFYFGWKKPYPKIKTVKRIIEMTDYYMKKYPRVELLLVGDGLSTEIIEKEYGLLERNMDGKRVTPQDENIKALHTFLDNPMRSIIVFNTYKLEKMCNWNFFSGGFKSDRNMNIKDVVCKDYVQYIFIHEFAHAIDTCYQLCDNTELKQLYEKVQGEYKNVKEFIAEAYTVSEICTGNTLANDVRKIIDKIVASN